MKVGAAGVDMEMGSAEDPDHSTLGRALESIFRKIESSEKLLANTNLLGCVFTKSTERTTAYY